MVYNFDIFKSKQIENTKIARKEELKKNISLNLKYLSSYFNGFEGIYFRIKSPKNGLIKEKILK